jgi:hypothetical protein
LALQLSAQGVPTAAIIDRFEATRQQLRSVDREADEDAVMDVLDCLMGWCHPEMKLL